MGSSPLLCLVREKLAAVSGRLPGGNRRERLVEGSGQFPSTGSHVPAVDVIGTEVGFRLEAGFLSSISCRSLQERHS